MNMAGLHYMLNPQFIKAYTSEEGYDSYGWDAARIYAPQTTATQFMCDVRVVYGAIASCIPTDVRGQRWITQYEATSDGLMVWSKFLYEFNQEGIIALKLSRLEEDLHTPYSRDQNGLGFLPFIDKIAKTFNQIESLANKSDAYGLVQLYGDRKKLNILNNAFKGSQYADNVYNIFMRCCENNTAINKFDYFTQQLNSWYLHSETGYAVSTGSQL